MVYKQITQCKMEDRTKQWWEMKHEWRETLEYLTSVAVREKPIESTLRFYLTLVRMVKISKIKDSSCCRGCGEKGSSHPLLLRLVQLLWNQCGVPQEAESGSTSRPIYLTLGHTPKGSTSYHRDTCSPMFTAALSVTARHWEQPRCPSTDE